MTEKPPCVFVVKFDCEAPGCQRFDKVFAYNEDAVDYINSQDKALRKYYALEKVELVGWDK